MTRIALALMVLLAGGVAAGSEVELRQSEYLLTNGLPSWSETSLSAEWSRDRHAGVGFTASTLERFGLRDWGMRAGAAWPSPWPARAASASFIATSPSRLKRPRYSGSSAVRAG